MHVGCKVLEVVESDSNLVPGKTAMMLFYNLSIYVIEACGGSLTLSIH